MKIAFHQRTIAGHEFTPSRMIRTASKIAKERRRCIGSDHAYGNSPLPRKQVRVLVLMD